MQIGDWKSAGSVAPLYRELEQLRLVSNIAELEAFGFTVVPPEKVAPLDFCEGVKEALERAMLRRYGPDGLDAGRWSNVNDIQRFMLWEDPIFERLSWNPAGLGLAEYLLGTDCVLSLCAAWVKGPGEARTGIHGDYIDPATVAQPEQVNNCNMHYMLTDYTRDDGAISFVPGSHKWRRQATPPEAKYWADLAVPVEAPAGSMVIWGNHSPTMVPDTNHATISGASVGSAVDAGWLADEFDGTVRTRGKAIINARGKSSAASAASAAIDHIHDWFLGTGANSYVSMAVPSNGAYGVPEGLIFSFPCRVTGPWEYEIVEGLELSAQVKERLQTTIDELVEERATVQEML